jgi:hypothetical protein
MLSMVMRSAGAAGTAVMVNETLSTFAVAVSNTRRNSDSDALIRRPFAMRIDIMVIHPHLN